MAEVFLLGFLAGCAFCLIGLSFSTPKPRGEPDTPQNMA
jgi:hypothetical protein